MDRVALNNKLQPLVSTNEQVNKTKYGKNYNYHCYL